MFVRVSLDSVNISTAANLPAKAIFLVPMSHEIIYLFSLVNKGPYFLIKRIKYSSSNQCALALVNMKQCVVVLRLSTDEFECGFSMAYSACLFSPREKKTVPSCCEK